MSEWALFVAAIAITMLVITPVITLISKAFLCLKRQRTRAFASFGDEATLAWIVAPTLLPLSWLLSSALHQSEWEAARSIAPLQRASCQGAAMVCVGVVTIVGAAIAYRAWRDRPRAPRAILDATHPLSDHVARIVRSDRALRSLRVEVAQRAPSPVYTVGRIRPRVIVDACFAGEADEAMLRAALLHERAHVAGRDMLRHFVARACLSLNPLGHLLLRPEFERWRQAREARCDGEAVRAGGEPLALAQGIVRAARFECGKVAPCGAIAPLCGHDESCLRLRLALLMHDATHAPARSRGHLVLAAATSLLLVLPHVQGLNALDALHLGLQCTAHVAPW